MSVLSGLFGDATGVDVQSLGDKFRPILSEGEQIEQAFRLVRDLIIFTSSRLVLVDRQGVTGKKSEYHSIPYRSISHFAVESKGHFDRDAELKIWVASNPHPIGKEFRRDDDVFEVQRAIAAHTAT